MPAQIKNSGLKQLTKALNQGIDDTALPQKVRACFEGIKSIFKNSAGTLEEKKNKALQLLEEVISDSDIDFSARTKLYNTINIIESFSFEE